VILKRLMKGKLPESILRRPKIGLDIPIHDWLRGPLRELLMDTFSHKAIEETGLFHKNAVQNLIADHMDRRMNVGYHLWGLMTLFLWMKHWNVQSTGGATQEMGARETVQSLA